MAERTGAPLVVGFDRHPASAAALRFAASLAAHTGAELHVVHVVDVEDYPVDPDADDWEDRAAAAVERQRDQARRLLEDFPGPWTYHTARGEPAHAILALAEAAGADMILIGRPSRDLAARVGRILGDSVSARLVHHSPRPVVLVPPQAHH